MLKIKQSDNSSTYKSDIGTKIFLGTRPENGKQVTTVMTSVNQYDDLATSQQEGGEFAIALKIYHTIGTTISQATLDEAVHYADAYLARVSELLDGPIEDNTLVDRVIV